VGKCGNSGSLPVDLRVIREGGGSGSERQKCLAFEISLGGERHRRRGGGGGGGGGEGGGGGGGGGVGGGGGLVLGVGGLGRREGGWVSEIVVWVLLVKNMSVPFWRPKGPLSLHGCAGSRRLPPMGEKKGGDRP